MFCTSTLMPGFSASNSWISALTTSASRPIAQKRTVVVPGSVRAQPAMASAARAGSAQRRRRSIQFGIGLLALACGAVGIVLLFLRGSRA
ncbi:hypothetical protein G6F46_015550 [Rhizopus delemar]|nr:hypothetical protein G6F46_015550 [Rhizopus delemar]